MGKKRDAETKVVRRDTGVAANVQSSETAALNIGQHLSVNTSMSFKINLGEFIVFEWFTNWKFSRATPLSISGGASPGMLHRPIRVGIIMFLLWLFGFLNLINSNWEWLEPTIQVLAWVLALLR